MSVEAAVLRLVKPGILEHWCDGCNAAHRFNVHERNRDGRVNGWDGDMLRPHMDTTLRFEAGGQVCEYILKAGVVLFMSNCSHALAGQQRHLRAVAEWPRGAA